MDTLTALSFFLNFAFMFTIGLGYLSVKPYRKSAVKAINPVAEIVGQICQSLKQDPGWEYISPIYVKDVLKRVSYWENKPLEIYIAFDQRTRDGPVVYSTTDDRVIHYFTNSELNLVKEVLCERELSILMSKRIDLLDKNLDEALKKDFVLVKASL